MQKPITEWNTTKKIWQRSTEDHLFELWEPFLEIWPTAATMRNGQVFEQQTRERPTTVSESSSLPILPTPIVSDGTGGSKNIEASAFSPQMQDITKLIPTPTTRDYKDGSEPHERDGVTQTDTVARAIFNSGEVLLPTTRAQNGKDRNNKIYARHNKQPQNLENALVVTLLPTTRTSMANGPTQKELDAGNPKHRLETVTNWGKFEPAIRRWEEVLGRPAPSPTKPDGKDGARRLSSAFTEWMMGLPRGWITDCGLSRNDELKACGNGVVPQQAELALRILLEDLPIISRRGGGK